MVHLKLCPEAGEETALSDYGAIVSAQIPHRGCTKFKVAEPLGRFAVEITHKPTSHTFFKKGIR